MTEYYVHAGKSADRDGDDSLSFQLRRTTIMYPIVHLPAIVNNEFTFEHRHTYVVDGNVSFLAPSILRDIAGLSLLRTAISTFLKILSTTISVIIFLPSPP